MRPSSFDCLGAIRGEPDIESPLAQPDGVKTSKVMIVFDDEDAPAHEPGACRKHARALARILRVRELFWKEEMQ